MSEREGQVFSTRLSEEDRQAMVAAAGVLLGAGYPNSAQAVQRLLLACVPDTPQFDPKNRTNYDPRVWRIQVSRGGYEHAQLLDKTVMDHAIDPAAAIGYHITRTMLIINSAEQGQAK